ncbi:hypothetical protein LCGC14_3006160, partial [marine sediment metagenome]
YMPFVEMVLYIADKRELLLYFVQHLCIYGSNILSDDFHASLSLRIPHRKLDNGDYEALKASDCSCLFYENYTKKSDHYATFPPNLIAPLIRATCPRWACPVCGQGWSPVVEKIAELEAHRNTLGLGPKTVRGGNKGTTLHHDISVNVKGYRPTCEHEHTIFEAVPGIVLDPFVGSGTTVQVAKQLLRRGVGLDISMDYLDEQAKIRTGAGSPSNVLDGLPLFERTNHD